MGISNCATPATGDTHESHDATREPAPNLLDLRPLAGSRPACCCAAQPVAVVVLAPTNTDRQAVDVLLCGHHLRASWRALQDAGALVVDAGGRLLMPTGWEPPPAPAPRVPSCTTL